MTVASGDEVAPEVARIVAGVLGMDRPPCPWPAARDVPTWTSHATVEMIFAIEDRYGFEMSSAEMERIAGVEDLVAIVRRRLLT